MYATWWLSVEEKRQPVKVWGEMLQMQGTTMRQNVPNTRVGCLRTQRTNVDVSRWFCWQESNHHGRTGSNRGRTQHPCFRVIWNNKAQGFHNGHRLQLGQVLPPARLSLGPSGGRWNACLSLAEGGQWPLPPCAMLSYSHARSATKGWWHFLWLTWLRTGPVFLSHLALLLVATQWHGEN